MSATFYIDRLVTEEANIGGTNVFVDNSNLVLNGDVLVTGELYANIAGGDGSNITIPPNLVVDSLTANDYIKVDGTNISMVNGNLVLDGDVLVTGELYANIEANIPSNVVVNSLTANDYIMVGDSNIYVNGAGNLVLDGDVLITGELYGGNIEANIPSNVVVDSLTANDYIMVGDSNIYVNGAGNLVLDDTVDISGDLNVDGNITGNISSTSISLGGIGISANLLTGDAVIDSGLDVEGTVTSNGDIYTTPLGNTFTWMPTDASVYPDTMGGNVGVPAMQLIDDDGDILIEAYETSDRVRFPGNIIIGTATGAISSVDDGMVITANGTLTYESDAVATVPSGNNTILLSDMDASMSHTIMSNVTITPGTVATLSSPSANSAYMVTMDVSMINPLTQDAAAIKHVSSVYGDANGVFVPISEEGTLYSHTYHGGAGTDDVGITQTPSGTSMLYTANVAGHYVADIKIVGSTLNVLPPP